jgi:hypothetical protein
LVEVVVAEVAVLLFVAEAEVAEDTGKYIPHPRHHLMNIRWGLEAPAVAVMVAPAARLLLQACRLVEVMVEWLMEVVADQEA